MTSLETRLSNIQNVTIGCISGVVEVLIQQPTVSVKNALQQGNPIVWNPKVLYRGVGVTCASIAPISGIQFAVNGALGRHFKSTGNSELSVSQRIGSAAVGGVCSAFISSPAELLMILQQHTGQSLKETGTEIIQKFGIQRLFQGFGITALREGVWAASYLALGPVIAETIERHAFSESSLTLSQQATASVAGSIIAGISAVIVTQPIDTLKTRYQGIALQEGRSSYRAVLESTWSDGGLKTLYRGTIPRGIRLVGAVFILGQSKKYLENMFIHLSEEC